MTDLVASTPPHTPAKLSEEPGFTSFEIFRPHYTYRFPRHTPGLLAFLFAEEESEMVLKIILCDDIAKGFLENRPFCGRANKAAYRVFEQADNYDARAGVLAERLKLYAQLTEKYNAPQTSWTPKGFRF
jgi:hypothetical protein